MKLFVIFYFMTLFSFTALSEEEKKKKDYSADFVTPFSSGGWTLVKLGYEPYVGTSLRRFKQKYGYQGEIAYELGFLYRQHMIIGYEGSWTTDSWLLPKSMNESPLKNHGFVVGFSINPRVFIRTRLEASVGKSFLRTTGQLPEVEGDFYELRLIFDLRLTPWSRAYFGMGQRYIQFAGNDIAAHLLSRDAFDGGYLQAGIRLGFFH